MRSRSKLLVTGMVLFSASCLVVFSGCTVGIGLKKEPMMLETRGGEPERTPVYEHAGWIIARGSIHNHTTYSDGCREADDLLELARQQGMAVLAYNDHREGKICTGEKGFFCGNPGGVEHYGYSVYFDHLRKIQEKARPHNMIVLKGLEVIPYFYNYGKAPSLVLDGLQSHFTVYGIEDEKVYEEMPAENTITIKPSPIPDYAPWQEWVDYILDHGGIVSAAHVEEGDIVWYGPAQGACPPPINNMHRIKRLTHFAALAYAWHEHTAGPGGLWDSTLLEYMAGVRERPMWATADADYHCEGSLAISNTMFYMREFTEDEVYRCMRDGRMVALQGDAFQDTYVSEWWVSDSGRPDDLVMLGREISIIGTPTIRFALDRPVDGCRVRLVRNGSVVLEQEGTEFTFRDIELSGKREPAFYRVEVIGPVADRGEYDGPTMPASELFVNPVFVRFAR